MSGAVRQAMGRAAAALGAAALGLSAPPLMAQDGGEGASAFGPLTASGQAGEAARRGPPSGVFDGDYATVALGLGLGPSYEGSDDYILIPAPRFAGRVKGIEFSSASGGPGLALDLWRDAPRARIEWIAGPALRVNLNRSSRKRIEDAAVSLLDKRKTAVELGGEFGVRINGIAARGDSLTFKIDALHDVAGAHRSVIVKPSISYATPLGRASFVQASLSANHVGDGYARHYFSVLPQEAARSGLPAFDAKGGFKNIGASVLGAYDLSGDALDGGFSIFAIGGYSRLLGDGAASPITAIRGSRNQAFVAVALGYTF